MGNNLRDMTWQQFTDYAAGQILLRLLDGQLKTGVQLMLEQGIRWYQEQVDKDTQKQTSSRVNGSVKITNCEGLTARARNVLVNNGMVTAGDVRRYVKDIDDLLPLGNCGRRTAHEIIEYFDVSVR